MMQRLLKSLFFNCKIAIVFLFVAFLALPAGAVDLTLGWDPNSEKDLEGYAVFKRIGSAPTSTDLDGYVAVRDLANPSHPVYTISGLKQGAKYYLALKAYNTAGVYSGFSNALCVQVGDTIGLCSDSSGGGGTGGGSGGGGGGGGCFIGSAGLNLSTGALAAALAALLISGLVALGWAQKQE